MPFNHLVNKTLVMNKMVGVWAFIGHWQGEWNSENYKNISPSIKLSLLVQILVFVVEQIDVLDCLDI